MNWVSRNAEPIRIVRTSPACSPRRLLRLIDCSAQCIVKLDVTRIAVLTPATNFGNSYGGGGQIAEASGLTTRTKKYAAKNEPNSIASEPMKRNIPRIVGSILELRFAIGGP